ncbi:MAG: hypothetical protein ACFFCI_22445, partial [Promethearchaeota archaeon]
IKIEPVTEEQIEEQETELNTEYSLEENADEYDSFVVEPSIEDEYPIETLSNYEDSNEKETIITNTQVNIEQEDSSKNENKDNAFDPETENRIKSLVNRFIEHKDEKENFNDDNSNTSLLEKEQKLEEDSRAYEEGIEIEKEIISTEDLNKLILQAREGFQSKGYAIISHSIENIDFLALKLSHINEELKMITLFPVIVCNLKGSLIIATNKIEYYPVHEEYRGNEFAIEELLGHIEKALKRVQDHVLWNISTEQSLFHYIRKKYDQNIKIEETKRGKKLFFRAGMTHYKITVNPIVLCKRETEFNEKILLFPYQRESNIHFIHFKKLLNLLAFLEQKYQLIETGYHNENVVNTYFHTQNRFIANTKNYSIPFVGVLIGLLILVWSVPLLSHICFNLSLGVITVYGIILGYLYLNFYKKKEEIAHEFATPCHKRPVNLDETDLEIIHEKLSPELMDQFIYECFGKEAKFHFIAQIEAQKADNFHYHRETEYENLYTEEESADEFLFAKGKHDDTRKKNRPVGTNYHLFMED